MSSLNAEGQHYKTRLTVIIQKHRVIPFRKETNTFNDQKRLSTAVFEQTKPPQLDWIKTRGVDCYYNPDGRLIQKVFSRWDSVAKTWIQDTRASFTYTDSERVWCTTNDVWSKNAWQFVQMECREYDSIGRFSSDTIYSWDAKKATWMIHYHDTHQYDKWGRELEWIKYNHQDKEAPTRVYYTRNSEYDSTKGKLVIRQTSCSDEGCRLSRDIMWYNKANKIVRWLSYSADGDRKVFYKSIKHKFFYTAEGEVLLEKQWRWGGRPRKWVLYMQTSYTY